MAIGWMREWLLADINYIPTFHRIWESIRKEVKMRDVKNIRTRSQALMQLRKEKSRLLFELRKTPDSKLVEADPETIEKHRELTDKKDRVTRLEGLLSRDKYPKRSFNEFIGKKQSIATYVDYVDNKTGKRIQYVREDNPWTKEEVDEIRRLVKVPVELLFKRHGDETSENFNKRLDNLTETDKFKKITSKFNDITKDKIWLPRTEGSVSSKINRLKKKGEL